MFKLNEEIDVFCFGVSLVESVCPCCFRSLSCPQFEFSNDREMITCQPGYAHPAAAPLEEFQGAAVKYLVKSSGRRKGGIGQVGVMVTIAVVGGTFKVQDIREDWCQ